MIARASEDTRHEEEEEAYSHPLPFSLSLSLPLSPVKDSFEMFEFISFRSNGHQTNPSANFIPAGKLGIYYSILKQESL